MYATVVFFSIVATLVLMGVHLALRGGRERPAPPVGVVSRLIYLLVLLSTLLAAASAWGPILRGQTMRGWALLAHSSAAGLLIVSLTSLVVIWAGGCRIAAEPDDRGRAFTLGTRLAFTLAAVAGLLVILSALLPMTPLFGTHEQELLIQTHRYAGLGLVLALMVHRYLLWLAQRRSRATKGAVQHEATTA